MARVSKKTLTEEQTQQLFSQFTSLFAQSNARQTELLFNSLFTETEKLMFIKRVAVVAMITEGFSTYAIAKSLKVSDSTARTIQGQCAAGEFIALQDAFSHRSFDSQKFWNTVETVLRGGLPEQGKNRWKWLRDMK